MIGVIKLFVCLECGSIFEEPAYWEEEHGLDTPPYESMSGCPSCYGSYVEAYKCDECGDWIDGKYIKTDSGDRICENCYIVYELGEE